MHEKRVPRSNQDELGEITGLAAPTCCNSLNSLIRPSFSVQIPRNYFSMGDAVPIYIHVRLEKFLEGFRLGVRVPGVTVRSQQWKRQEIVREIRGSVIVWKGLRSIVHVITQGRFYPPPMVTTIRHPACLAALNTKRFLLLRPARVSFKWPSRSSGYARNGVGCVSAG